MLPKAVSNLVVSLKRPEADGKTLSGAVTWSEFKRINFCSSWSCGALLLLFPGFPGKSNKNACGHVYPYEHFYTDTQTAAHE